MFAEFLQAYLLDLGRFSLSLFGGLAALLAMFMLVASPDTRASIFRTLRPLLRMALYCELALGFAIAPVSARAYQFPFPDPLAVVFACVAIALWMSAGKIMFRNRA